MILKASETPLIGKLFNMLTRNSNKNNNHCIRCKCVYTPDPKLDADNYPYCTLCNYHRTKAALKLMKEVNPELETQAGKRNGRKVKQYRPDYVVQVT